MDNATILKDAESLFKTQVNWRRHLHQHPELSTQEQNTTRFINDILKKEKIKIIPLKGMKTGTAALIEGGRSGRTAALRTDIDALPICEQNSIPFKSKNPGVMHACGHDVHMATILGATLLLNRMKDRFAGKVKILFQPAEELPPGGAREMIKAGILKNPKIDMLFALHTDPMLPVGQISLRDGPTMASVTDFNITVHGIGGHAAKPHQAVDAVVTAAEIVSSIQKVVSREVNPLEPAVITFGTIEGGTARNVIAESVRLQGTARTLSPSTLKRLPRLIRRTIGNICKARGAKAEIEFVADYPVMSNHGKANRIIERTAAELFGRKIVKETPPGMGGEDFACYLEEVPGAMFRLGTRNSKIGADKMWHSSDFMVDENAIKYGTAILVGAVRNFLGD